jgi:drug/metabolite transporter (DMT)-like permease
MRRFMVGLAMTLSFLAVIFYGAGSLIYDVIPPNISSFIAFTLGILAALCWALTGLVGRRDGKRGRD